MTEEEKKQRQREACARWREKHKEELREYHRNWYKKNGERRRAYARKWYSSNKEHAKELQAAYWKRKILAELEQEQTVTENVCNLERNTKTDGIPTIINDF